MNCFNIHLWETIGGSYFKSIGQKKDVLIIFFVFRLICFCIFFCFFMAGPVGIQLQK